MGIVPSLSTLSEFATLQIIGIYLAIYLYHSLNKGVNKMTLQEKRDFIQSLIETVETEIMNKTGKMPENWDGHELRLYIKDKFSDVVWGDVNKKSKRYRDYKNTVLVDNL